ncbi:Serine/threonine-protein kinase VHS1 [Yarrowia sp. C11]|nr:Serine/threonine-protein kinase VHS1 [Yarrowia sp. E02]KAG5372994.1 Serine/threonine-protein kinase VHS1 [Yarrowia sp. C11]
MHKLNARLGNLRLEEVIGTGAYGTVYRATDIYSNKRYAVKVVGKRNPLTDCRSQVINAHKLSLQQVSLAALNHNASHIYREIALHNHVQVHPYILSLYAVYEASDCLYIVLEHCEDDLFTAIVERGMFQNCASSAKIILLQLLEAVLYTHNKGVYHCDLKPENILVAEGGTCIRLADFGLASRSGQQVSQCGSSFYMSPERQTKRHMSQSVHQINAGNAAADVWSLGVIAINLFCGRNPWKRAHTSDEAYRQYLKDPSFLQQILPVSDEFAGILNRIFTADIKSRISLTQLREEIKNCDLFVHGQEDVLETTYTTECYVKAPVSPVSPASLLPAPSLKSNLSPLSHTSSSVSPLSHTSSIFSTPYTPDVSPTTAPSDRGVKRRRSEENEPFHFSLNHTSDVDRFDFGMSDPRARLFA